MHRHLDSQDEYREVGGELVSGTIVESRTTHLEVLTRRATRPISWRFRQPRLALFWFRNGLKELHLELDGRRIHSGIRQGTSLALLPASTSVEGEFKVASSFDYTVVFLDPTVATDAGCHFDRPLIAFGNEDLQRGLSVLCREARNADSLYGLFAEGWAMQALALLARGRRQPASQRSPVRWPCTWQLAARHRLHRGRLVEAVHDRGLGASCRCQSPAFHSGFSRKCRADTHTLCVRSASRAGQGVPLGSRSHRNRSCLRLRLQPRSAFQHRIQEGNRLHAVRFSQGCNALMRHAALGVVP
jgi:hypothetical protein